MRELIAKILKPESVMKFTVVEGASGGGGRLGVLDVRGTRLETPRAAVLTRAGSVPHVTRGVLERALPAPQLLLAPLSSCLHLEAGARAAGAGLAAFCGARPDDVWLVLPEDASVETPEGHFERDAVPLWTRHGKVSLDPDKYMQITETLCGDAVAALADTRTSPSASRPRLLRAAARTSAALAACLDRRTEKHRHVLGVVTGWGCPEALTSSVAAVRARAPELAGTVLAGLLATADAPTAAASDLPSDLEEVVRSLPGAVVAPGWWSPSALLRLAGAGCAAAGGGESAGLAGRGAAAVFPLRPGEAGALVLLDIADERYRTDFSPLLADCACLACRSHTRAYLHHLWSARELLAPLLLTLHNLHHYDRMFAEVRRALAEGQFDQLRAHVEGQHAAWVEQHPRAVVQDACAGKQSKRLGADS